MTEEEGHKPRTTRWVVAGTICAVVLVGLVLLWHFLPQIAFAGLRYPRMRRLSQRALVLSGPRSLPLIMNEVAKQAREDIPKEDTYGIKGIKPTVSEILQLAGESPRAGRALATSLEGWNGWDAPTFQGRYLLRCAVSDGHKAALETLLAAGVRPNFLPAAVKKGCTEIVRTLVKHGAPVDGPCMGSTMDAAIDHGNVRMVELLVELGADVNRDNVPFGPPLVNAAIEDHTAIAEILLSNGADVGASDPGGLTSLHHAAGNGSLKMARILIANGADVNARDLEDAETPLDLADGPDMAAFLRSHGAKTSAELDLKR